MSPEDWRMVAAGFLLVIVLACLIGLMAIGGSVLLGHYQ